MQIQKETKLFAFKLADKKEQDAKPGATPWQVRDGVAVAGCSTMGGTVEPREGRSGGTDNGVWC